MFLHHLSFFTWIEPFNYLLLPKEHIKKKTTCLQSSQPPVTICLLPSVPFISLFLPHRLSPLPSVSFQFVALCNITSYCLQYPSQPIFHFVTLGVWTRQLNAMACLIKIYIYSYPLWTKEILPIYADYWKGMRFSRFRVQQA